MSDDLANRMHDLAARYERASRINFEASGREPSVETYGLLGVVYDHMAQELRDLAAGLPANMPPRLPSVDLTADSAPVVVMDCYDAIDIVAARTDAPSRLLAETARRAADLWNDPPGGGPQRDNVREVYPELGPVLDDLLGGGPCS